MSSPSPPPHLCSCEAHPTEQAPERGRRPNNEEQNAKIPPAQQANDPMQCVHDCACTPASHMSSNTVLRSLRCSGLIEGGRWRANIEGVSDPYKGYTPLVRKARITRLTLMPICCRFTVCERLAAVPVDHGHETEKTFRHKGYTQCPPYGRPHHRRRRSRASWSRMTPPEIR